MLIGWHWKCVELMNCMKWSRFSFSLSVLPFDVNKNIQFYCVIYDEIPYDIYSKKFTYKIFMSLISRCWHSAACTIKWSNQTNKGHDERHTEKFRRSHSETKCFACSIKWRMRLEKCHTILFFSSSFFVRFIFCWLTTITCRPISAFEYLNEK